MTTVTSDEANTTSLLELHTDTIKSNINSILTFIQHNIGQLTSLVLLKGKYISPLNFTHFVLFEQSVENLPLIGYRWIPYISLTERAEYETTYKTYYGANFSILNIFFTGNNFIISPAPNKSFYYPFTISVPEYVLSPMGGDFLYGSVTEIFNTSLQQKNVSASKRVPLFNNTFGIYISQVIRNNSHIMGVIQLLLSPQELIIVASSLTTFRRSYYDLFIFDLSIDKNETLLYKQDGYNINSLDDLHLNRFGTTMRKISCFNRIYAIVFIYHKDILDAQETRLPLIVLLTCFSIIAVINITAIIVYLQYYKALKEREQDVNRKMLSYINHELRNPLHVIMSLTYFVRTSLLGKSVMQLQPGETLDVDNMTLMYDLNTIKGHIHLMSHIVNDVLTMQSIEQGKLMLNISSFKLSALLESLSVSIKAKVTENSNLRFIKDVPVDETFNADQYRIIQILINLLSNAVKFTVSGSITLIMKRLGDNMYFCVKDTGTGVPANKTNLLFVKFAQLNSLRHTGSGLGLYISKQLVVLMGGEIGYYPNIDENGQPKGSIFWFTIPYVNTIESQSPSLHPLKRLTRQSVGESYV